jgi:hypothetical protein
MILEYLGPCARRHTHTAGTTEAGLLGLLDVVIHGTRVLKRGCEVNPSFALDLAVVSNDFGGGHIVGACRAPTTSVSKKRQTDRFDPLGSDARVWEISI